MLQRIFAAAAFAAFTALTVAGAQGQEPKAAASTEATKPAKAQLTPEAVRDMVAKDGAKATVNKLWASGADGNRWDKIVLARIASGHQAWLDLVPVVTPGSDAATAEGLQIAVSQALPHNAPGALRLASKAYPLENICSMMEIEPTPKRVAAFKAAAIKAVEAVSEPDLADKRAACLKILKK